MSQENNKITIRRFYDEVINQKNLAVIEELYSASYVSHDLPSDPTELKHFINSFHTAFPDGQISIEEVIAEGDTVAMREPFAAPRPASFRTSRPRARPSRSRPRTCIV